MATTGMDWAARCRRWVSRCSRTLSISSRSSEIRPRIRRRSISSFVSPGPRTPIAPPTPPAPALRVPPACWESSTPRPLKRGKRYSSWANSTCKRPSRVRACWAKISRMSAVRSITRASRTSPGCAAALGKAHHQKSRGQNPVASPDS